MKKQMSGDSYKSQKRARIRIVLIISLIIIYLLGVTSYDAFVSTPIKKERVEALYSKFIDMKNYLDAKLPEIDTALSRHEQQIAEQNEQLKELNRLTEVLKNDQDE
jgi:flagellar basal body-associated protein FliL